MTHNYGVMEKPVENSQWNLKIALFNELSQICYKNDNPIFIKTSVRLAPHTRLL